MKSRTLTTIGLSLRLEVLIKSHLKLVNARTVDHWSFSDESNSDILICDPDSPLSAITVKRARETGSPICISLVDSRHQPLPGTAVLHDPLRVTDVIELLDRVSGGAKASALTRDDVACEMVEENSAYAPNHRTHFARTLHALMNAGSRDLHLIEAGAIRFCMLPVSRSVFLQEPLSETWLDWILDVDQEATATVIPIARQQQVLSEFLHRASLIKLLWHAGLNGVQTEQMASLDTMSPVSLSRWPDFGNLKHKPIHLRMAAELSRKRMNHAQLAHVTHASIELVGAFINACALCNLINTGPLPTPPSIRVVLASQAARAMVAPRRSLGFLQSIRMALGLRVA